MEFKGTKKKPFRLGTIETVDMETGETTGVKRNAFTMLPPPANLCQECAIDHPHDQPHNQQSLFYQYQFRAKHGRWPTWTDAMTHCTEDVRANWRTLLIEQMNSNGVPVPEDLMEPSVSSSSSPSS